MSKDLTNYFGTSKYDLENAMNKNLKNLRYINRLLKRLEAMDLNEESKDYLDRNKKVLRSNLKIANKSVNDLKHRNRPSYSPSYSSYDNSSSDDSAGLWIFFVILFFIFMILAS